ncbi:uncharacterized protein [Miscanthus floridulus]|uniref:uncharacterized protein n=1 Tax=Miscanthus floridulus TaxID=154761 RepID=UPI00345A787A
MEHGAQPATVQFLVRSFKDKLPRYTSKDPSKRAMTSTRQMILTSGHERSGFLFAPCCPGRFSVISHKIGLVVSDALVRLIDIAEHDLIEGTRHFGQLLNFRGSSTEHLREHCAAL